MTANNVVLFPSKNTKAQIPNLEEIQEQVKMSREETAEIAAMTLTEDLFNNLDMFGFNVGGKNCFKDSLLLVQSVNSLIYRSLGIEHTLHKVVEKIISVPDEYYDTIVEESNED